MNDIHITPVRAQRWKRPDQAAAVSCPICISHSLAPFDAIDEERLQHIEATGDRILAEIGSLVRGGGHHIVFALACDCPRVMDRDRGRRYGCKESMPGMRC